MFPERSDSNRALWRIRCRGRVRARNDTHEAGCGGVGGTHAEAIAVALRGCSGVRQWGKNQQVSRQHQGAVFDLSNHVEEVAGLVVETKEVGNPHDVQARKDVRRIKVHRKLGN